jgi:hypothetical protein
MTLSEAVQLHESIEILYVVTHWEAVFTVHDGSQEIARTKGDSPEEAFIRMKDHIGLLANRFWKGK